jgi:hypothetical protein
MKVTDHNKIVSMRASGATLQAIGGNFQVSRRRIHQILNRLASVVVQRGQRGQDAGLNDHFPNECLDRKERCAATVYLYFT